MRNEKYYKERVEAIQRDVDSLKHSIIDLFDDFVEDKNTKSIEFNKLYHIVEDNLQSFVANHKGRLIELFVEKTTLDKQIENDLNRVLGVKVWV